MKTMLFLASALLFAAPAAAQPRGTARRVAPAPAQNEPQAPRVQRLSFENEYVTGTRDLGGGDVLGVTRRAKHGKLVKSRADFIPELLKSAEDI